MDTMRAERTEGGLWATYARNIATNADTQDTGAIAVAGGFAICLQGTFLEYAVGIGTRGPLDETDLGAVGAFYARRGLPARIELHEEVAARDAALIEQHGYRLELRLDILEAEIGPVDVTPPHGMAVERTENRSEWAEIVSQACDDSDRARVTRSMQVNAHAAVLFAVTLNGQTIGGGAVATFEDGALLFGGGVLPPYRAHGAHSALIRSRLAYARSRGSSFAIIKTAPGSPSAHNALECGFVRTHARLRFRKA